MTVGFGISAVLLEVAVTVRVCALSLLGPEVMPDRLTVWAAASSRIVSSPIASRVGASLTGVTVIATESVSLLAPPVPVKPWSLVVIVRLAEPLKLDTGL